MQKGIFEFEVNPIKFPGVYSLFVILEELIDNAIEFCRSSFDLETQPVHSVSSSVCRYGLDDATFFIRPQM
ncbi:hypothetical protein LAZ67_3000863 [Cordylochernes scorpioides]|uniref:GHKL domain-containing protein n=1 Tax=Cordylochernes scorpioides TaxID=51811 RepID=A0ABY6K9T5_9ARAC|nr:hypothetical protein LAZ67_3000863 [Cordylochernes scorpioides]